MRYAKQSAPSTRLTRLDHNAKLLTSSEHLLQHLGSSGYCLLVTLMSVGPYSLWRILIYRNNEVWVCAEDISLW